MELRELYELIDQQIEQGISSKKKKPPCVKGCASCCSQFFEITEVEFQYIFETISNQPKEIRDFYQEKSQLMMELLKKYHPGFYRDYYSEEQIPFEASRYYKSSERYKIHIPCIFLTEEGACRVYSHRPLVCRTTGVSFTSRRELGAICRELRSALLARKVQADLTSLKVHIDEIRSRSSERQYPMFYWVFKTLRE